MKEAQRQTRSFLQELFEQHGFHPRTDLGQNFLIDINLVEYIAQQAHLQLHDVVLEVGAGTGGLTTFLARKAAHVVSIELDTRMFGLATNAVKDCSNVTLMRCDALKNKNNFSEEVLRALDEQLAKHPKPKRVLKLVANLPYNIATPVISNLVVTNLPWELMVVTIQLELGKRIVAKPGSSNYGALSVWLQSQCHVKLLKRLPPTVFWPRPRVNSAIVQVRPDVLNREKILDRVFLQDFLRRLFHQRRKFGRSVLVGMYRKQMSKGEVDETIAKLELPERFRAENLDVSTLVSLGNEFCKKIRMLSTRESLPRLKAVKESPVKEEP